MKDLIEHALRAPVGKPLRSSGRAADLQWFQFGDRRWVPAFDGGTKQVGEFALHVQCAWRITARDRIVVASRDLYYPPGETDEVPEDFDWDLPGGNRRDERVQRLLAQHAAQPLAVTAVEADRNGGARLFLTHDHRLEVFPDDSFSDEVSEHWRLFQPGVDSEHFVVTGHGVDGDFAEE